jgi:HPt (histidine-containing phosphotransfer) domain-containing protein
MQTPHEHLTPVAQVIPTAGGLELEKTLDRLGGDWALFEEVCDIFLEESSAMLHAVHEAIRERNPENLHRSSHSLKGAVSVLGADDCVESALALEQMGRQNAMESAAEVCAALERKLALLTASILTLRKTSKREQ